MEKVSNGILKNQIKKDIYKANLRYYSYEYLAHGISAGCLFGGVFFTILAVVVFVTEKKLKDNVLYSLSPLLLCLLAGFIMLSVFCIAKYKAYKMYHDGEKKSDVKSDQINNERAKELYSRITNKEFDLQKMKHVNHLHKKNTYSGKHIETSGNIETTYTTIIKEDRLYMFNRAKEVFGSDSFKSLIIQKDWRLMAMCIDFDKFVSGKNEKYIGDFNKYHAVDRSTFDAKIKAIEAYCNNQSIDVSPIKNRIILECFNVANDSCDKIDKSQPQTVVSSNNDVFENLVLSHFQKCYRSK